MINTLTLKESISGTNLPGDLRNLILATEDMVSEDQFTTKFLEWRKIVRMKDDEKK